MTPQEMRTIQNSIAIAAIAIVIEIKYPWAWAYVFGGFAIFCLLTIAAMVIAEAGLRWLPTLRGAWGMLKSLNATVYWVVMFCIGAVVAALAAAIVIAVGVSWLVNFPEQTLWVVVGAGVFYCWYALSAW